MPLNPCSSWPLPPECWAYRGTPPHPAVTCLLSLVVIFFPAHWKFKTTAQGIGRTENKQKALNWALLTDLPADVHVFTYRAWYCHGKDYRVHAVMEFLFLCCIQKCKHARLETAMMVMRNCLQQCLEKFILGQWWKACSKLYSSWGSMLVVS